ncbi:MAG TPA: lactonase family protein [Aliidongia sp.]|uniref:lactonase family protein n=1 Tax=Aliidongia sp. TaxID=1914230 RepID=UPI002DDCAA29|nr:lactonase family protein [Aliidongia sp.]HEV2678043.1 lactonase family protein [Aliidongia sp.]
MAPNDKNDSEPGFSRRSLLMGATAMTAVGLVPKALAATVAAQGGGGVLAYAGCYTPNGGGIYQFRINLATGALTQANLFPGVPNPSWITFGLGGTTLYATNEIDNYNGTTSGSVSAFRIDRSTGTLTALNVVSSEGGAPVYLNPHPSGKFLFVANYDGGSIAVLPIRSDGSLGAATDVKLDTGNVGPTTPTGAPPGSFANSGHDAPHAHFIHSDPSGRFVLHVDLGQDRIYSWRFNATAGTLSPAAVPFVAVAPGAGPRHLAFHPNGRLVYLLTEESSTLSTYAYNGNTGALTLLQTVSALPRGFAGTSYGSEVALSADGRFLYAANRLHDSIATFAIDGAGGLTLVGHTPTMGDYPRSFAIDPTGNFFYATNQHSDAITVFKIDRTTGQPAFTGQYVPIGSPARLAFLI